MNNDFLVPQNKKPTPQPEPIDPPEAPADEPMDAIDASEPAAPKPIKIDMSLDDSNDKKAPKKKRRNPKQWFLGLTKKQKIITVIVIILVLAGIIGGLLLAFPGNTATAPSVKKAAKAKVVKPTTEPSKLSGLQVKPELNKRGVTGVMIENSVFARPQAGIIDAGVVFEAIAEGGITRFLALFQDTQPDSIGPVRSVRPYYLDWLQGFGAPIAHAGGSAAGLNKIKDDNIKDINDNVPTFFRVDNREAPHNLFTTSAKLDSYRTKNNYPAVAFKGFPRKKEQPSAKPTAKTIDFAISSSDFNVHYDYDATTNSYKRSVGGAPHMDEKSKVQISPKVVIANIMSYTIVDSQGHSGYNTIGSGQSYIFQDGNVTVGSWEKTSSTAQITFKDSRGNDVKLNPGNTWISAVNNAPSVTYTPAP
ncbi:MAG: DUF3048 domain-containing protein [Candidatus Saccharibacteria bacterium]|nr:DUF3048 domain-containing protein [Candidatus Saccharibacteria bacterium]